MKFFGLSYRPRLRTVLILANVFLLLLPIGSIYLLRIYENELVRQTETELYVQGAAVAALYREHFLEMLEAQGGDPAHPPGLRLGLERNVEYFQPVQPSRDLALDTIHPPLGDALPAPLYPGSIAQDAGQASRSVLIATQRISLAGIRITDHQGVIVASTGWDTGYYLGNSMEFLHARTGSPASFLRLRQHDDPPPALASISRGTSIRVYAAMPIMQGNTFLGAVILNRTPRSMLKAMYGKRLFFLMVGVLLVAAALLLALFIAYMLTSPINALIRQARKLADGGFSALSPPGHYGTKEVEELSAAFFQMARDIEGKTNYIRDFAAHVSHEFKTPLAGIRGALELLIDHADSMEPEQRARFLSNMSKDADRLERLVSRLLELARADVFTPGRESCSPRDVVEKLAGRYAERGLDVVWTQGATPDLAMGRDALDAVLSNLLDNSLAHGAENVGVSAAVLDGTIRLRVEDDGPGVSQSNRGKIFTPFFTTRRSSGGTGLGLSIAHALLAAHKGRISLAGSPSGGACFEITLPGAGAGQEMDEDRNR